MLQRNFVIYTLDKKYGKKLLEMAINQKKKGLHFYLFHESEKVEEFTKEQEIEYLVLGSEIPIESRAQMEAKKKFLLSEEASTFELESEQTVTGREEFSGGPPDACYIQQDEISIFKYQKGEHILKEIYSERETSEERGFYREGETTGECSCECSKTKGLKGAEGIKDSRNEYRKTVVGAEKVERGEGENENEEEGSDRKLIEEALTREALARENQTKENKKKETKAKKNKKRLGLPDEIAKEERCGKVIGIYSPIHRIGKTKFAISLGKEMAKGESVLYLSLEPFAKGSYFEEGEEGDLSNLLYFGSQENQNLGLCISVMAGQLGKLDYIQPMPFMEDLYAVDAKRWKELMNKILEQSIYQTIILDINDGVKDLFEILDFCDTVYTLYIEESIAKEKLKQYTDNLIKTGYDSVLEHTVQKKVEVK